MTKGSILFGIWSLSASKLAEPTISKLRSIGYNCLVFTLQRSAQEYLRELGHVVIDVTTRRLGSQHPASADFPISYEAKANHIVSDYGKTPVWNLEDVRQSIITTYYELSQLRTEDVAAVVLWGGRLSFQRVMGNFACIQRIPLIYMERGHFPETLIIDEFELDENTEFRTLIWPFLSRSGDSAILEKGGQLCNELISSRATLENQNQTEMTRESLLRALNLEPHKKLIFVPLQVPIDTNVIFRTYDIQGNEDLVGTVIKAAQGMDDVEVLVKFHPGDKWTNRKRFCKKFPRIRSVDGIHVHDIIRNSDLVITMNSQVCIESILYEKPVITCGRSHFGGLVNHYHVRTKEDVISAIQQSLSQPRAISLEDRNKFIYGLRNIYLLDNPEGGARRIDHKIIRNNLVHQSKIQNARFPELRIGFATDLLDNPADPFFVIRTERIRRELQKYGRVTYLEGNNIRSHSWDIVWLTHWYDTQEITSILNRVGCLIFDINDSLLDDPFYARPAREFADLSDIVVFSSNYLRTRHGHLVKRPHVLHGGFELPPPSLSVDRRHSNSIVWMGHGSDFTNLEEIYGVLAIATKDLSTKIKILSTENNEQIEKALSPRNDNFDGCFEFHEWKPETYYQVLARSDVGIAPLSICSANMSVTAEKILTYQAAGLCVIAQAGIPSYEYHIQHGENGLLAFTAQDYLDAIKFLRNHPEEKERIRSNAQASVQAYSDEALKRSLQRIMTDAFTIGSIRHYMIEKN